SSTRSRRRPSSPRCVTSERSRTRCGRRARSCARRSPWRRRPEDPPTPRGVGGESREIPWRSLDSRDPFVYNPPVMHQQHLDATFAALADPTRRAILARLASGQASVTELAKPFAMSQPAVSKHLKVLERAGLISRGRDAQRRPRRLEPKRLGEATKWLERYRRLWEGNYQRLDALLEQLKAKEKKWERTKH